METERLKRVNQWQVDNGLGLGVVNHKPFLTGNVIGQLSELWRVAGKTRMNGRGQTSIQTSYLHKSTSELIIRELKANGWRGTLIFNIKREDVRKLCEQWAASDLAPATIAARITAFRKLARLLNRPELVPSDTTKIGIDPKRMARTQVAARNKGALTTEEFDRLVENVSRDDVAVAVVLRLCYEFGLRRKEAIMCRVELEGDKLVLKHGTKGGRERAVPIVTARQRAVLSEARMLMKLDGGKSVSEGCGALRTTINRVTYLTRKHGLTEAQMGVTVHGLRHAFAHRQLEQRGMAAGVKLTDDQLAELAAPDKVEKDAALLDIAEQLGHGRTRVGANYYGSARAIRVLPAASTSKWASGASNVTVGVRICGAR